MRMIISPSHGWKNACLMLLKRMSTLSPRTEVNRKPETIPHWKAEVQMGSRAKLKLEVATNHWCVLRDFRRCASRRCWVECRGPSVAGCLGWRLRWACLVSRFPEIIHVLCLRHDVTSVASQHSPPSLVLQPLASWTSSVLLWWFCRLSSSWSTVLSTLLVPSCSKIGKCWKPRHKIRFTHYITPSRKCTSSISVSLHFFDEVGIAIRKDHTLPSTCRCSRHEQVETQVRVVTLNRLTDVLKTNESHSAKQLTHTTQEQWGDSNLDGGDVERNWTSEERKYERLTLTIDVDLKIAQFRFARHLRVVLVWNNSLANSKTKRTRRYNSIIRSVLTWVVRRTLRSCRTSTFLWSVCELRRWHAFASLSGVVFVALPPTRPGWPQVWSKLDTKHRWHVLRCTYSRLGSENVACSATEHLLNLVLLRFVATVVILVILSAQEDTHVLHLLLAVRQQRGRCALWWTTTF